MIRGIHRIRVILSGMRIYLVRHGDAVPEEDAGSDRDRWLSEKGREHARVLGRLLREQRVEPDVILSSPLPRAVQTAELLVAAFETEIPVEVIPELAPDGAVRDLVAMVRQLPAEATLVLVGHEPSLSAIGAVLVDGPDFEALAKAQAARIDDCTVRWRFAWDAEAPQQIR